MEKIKSFTSLKQSKVLAKILPLESADMVYTMTNGYHTPFIRIETIQEMDKDDVCAWSLAALLNILERGALFKTPQGWVCHAYIVSKTETTNYYDNPIDACVELVLKLHKLELL